jgi:hypothetical protein
VASAGNSTRRTKASELRALMIDDLLELLDRQYQVASVETEPVRFLFRLKRFVDFVGSEPRLDAVVRDLKLEADSVLQGYVAHVSECVADLNRLRIQLHELIPSEVPPPPPYEDATEVADEWRYFDATVRDAGAALPSFSRSADGRTDTSAAEQLGGTLFEILKDLRPRLPRPDAEALVPLQDSVANTVAAHRHAFRAFRLDSANLAGVSHARILDALAALNPTPDLRPFDNASRLVSALLRSRAIAQKAVFASEVSADDSQRVSALTDELRLELRQVYEELRQQLGMARSLRQIFLRYKARCELYDRARLRELVSNRSRPEDTLTAQCALYLFDQGLNPITRPMAGPLQPDLVDMTGRTRLYVEAKQYKNTDGRSTIRKGAQQAWDTVHALRGTQLEVHEAFLLVFRRAGPLYLLPQSVPSQVGITLYPILVDIAESRDIGSRQRAQPVEISPTEFLPSTKPAKIPKALPRGTRAKR